MSTKAAYVYALLALGAKRQESVASVEQVADESPAVASQAQTLWQQATMLLPPDILLEKFTELAELKEAYASAPPLPGASQD